MSAPSAWNVSYSLTTSPSYINDSRSTISVNSLNIGSYLSFPCPLKHTYSISFSFALAQAGTASASTSTIENHLTCGEGIKG